MKTRFTLRSLLVLACALLAQSSATAGKKLKVYFIGNSYIYTNNMPQVIADIATAMGDTLVFQQHTVGGYSLIDHWDIPPEPCMTQISTGNYDYIVLQEQSQRPAFPASDFLYTYAYAKNFVRYTDTTSCANSMFFMTWGYKNGDPTNCPLPNNYTALCTYESMDSTIRARYMMMADSFHADVSPVGAVRHFIRHNFPGIDLYQADGSHPSVEGTYAGAVCFYTALFRRDPLTITYNGSLNGTVAGNIRTAAKTVVYDSMSKWHLGVHDLTASFTHSQSGNLVSFTNTTASLKKGNYKWDFGDGNMSTLTSPTHTYTTSGSYNVKLTVFDTSGSCSNTTTKTISVYPAIVSNISGGDFILSPNPAGNYITLQSQVLSKKSYSVTILSANGQVVYTGNTNKQERQQLDISTLSPGVYFIHVSDGVNAACKGSFVKE